MTVFTLHFQCLIFFVLFFNGMFLMKWQFSGVSGGLKWGSPGAWFEDLGAGSASLSPAGGATGPGGPRDSGQGRGGG